MTPSYVMCQLDENTQLVATSEAFVLTEKTERGEWAPRYFYSEIGDAIRGYTRHALRSPKTIQCIDGSLRGLIDAVERLEKTIKDVSEKTTQTWQDHFADPIESYLLKLGELSNARKPASNC